jgi:protein phosphatase
VGNSALEPGDTYLICSDGLHGAVTDVEIARLLRDPDGDLESQAEALLDAALAAGGSDNISLILARPLVD